MEDFKTYNELKRLSSVLYSDSDDLQVNYQICWSNSINLIEALTDDLKKILNEACYVTSLKFILQDDTYRQGASGCFCEIKFDQSDEFTLLVECLIDFDKIQLRVKQRPLNPKFDQVSQQIELNYNSEFWCEMNHLKN